MNIFCVCGIDTGVGKTMVTGLLAKHLLDIGKSVITKKLVQTGCHGQADDILVHRKLMGINWKLDDRQRLTCPYCFPFPCSPHLAAKLAGERIDTNTLDRSVNLLADRYEWLLMEGAGGLMVPLNRETTQIDYLKDGKYPIILVTSPRLGSINHTLLSLEALHSRGMELTGLVYNLFDQGPREIAHDTLQLFSEALIKYKFDDKIVVLHDQRTSDKEINWLPMFPDLKETKLPDTFTGPNTK